MCLQIYKVAVEIKELYNFDINYSMLHASSLFKLTRHVELSPNKQSNQYNSKLYLLLVSCKNCTTFTNMSRENLSIKCNA